MRTGKMITVAAVGLMFLAGSAWAQAKHDTFRAGINSYNVLAQWGGSGWNNGEWIEYDQHNDPDPTPWWNQWFYDDPPDPDRWKEIDYLIQIDNLEVVPLDIVEIAINWSTIDFPETGPDGPPPMPDQEQYIERLVIFSEPVQGMGTIVDGHLTIPEYNPEWVSIDVRVLQGTQGSTFYDISGEIWHECVPEPTTLSLLALGALSLLRRRQH